MDANKILPAGLVLIILFYIPVILLNNEILFLITAEDAFYEALGTLLFFLASLLFLHIFLSTKSRNFFFLLFFLTFFFAAGEEISWGQRIFKFETPALLFVNNAQQEFNIHNLNFIQHENGIGTSIKGLLLNFNRLFMFSCAIYCIYIPLANRYSNGISNLLSKIRLPIISSWFGALFVFNEFASKALETFVIFCQSDQCPKVYEIKEAVWGLLVFLWASYFFIKFVAISSTDTQAENLKGEH